MDNLLDFEELVDNLTTKLKTRNMGYLTSMPQIRFAVRDTHCFQFVFFHFRYVMEGKEKYFKKPGMISFADAITGEYLGKQLLEDSTLLRDIPSTGPYPLRNTSKVFSKSEMEDLKENALRTLHEIRLEYLQKKSINPDKYVEYLHYQLLPWSDDYTAIALSLSKIMTGDSANAIQICPQCHKQFIYSTEQLKPGQKYKEECDKCHHTTQKIYNPSYKSYPIADAYYAYTADTSMETDKDNSFPDSALNGLEILPVDQNGEIMDEADDLSLSIISEEYSNDLPEDVSDLQDSFLEGLPEYSEALLDPPSDTTAFIPDEISQNSESSNPDIIALQIPKKVLPEVRKYADTFPESLVALCCIGGIGCGISTALNQILCDSDTELLNVFLETDFVLPNTSGEKCIVFWLRDAMHCEKDIISFMKSHLECIFIFRGIEPDIMNFFNMNTYLKEYILLNLPFPSYSIAELKEIFYLKCAQYKQNAKSLEDYLNEYLDTHMTAITVSHLAKRIIFQHHMRCALIQETGTSLSIEDVKLSISKLGDI